MTGTRRCSKCKKVKPLSEFYKDKKGRDGYGYSCKPCTKANVKKHHEANIEARRASQKAYAQRPEIKEATRNRRLQEGYGISLDDYSRLLAKQQGTCAICRENRRDSRNRAMPVDHDHHTGAVRGILCDQCNRIIGLFNDDPDTIDKAIRYLQAWKKRVQ